MGIGGQACRVRKGFKAEWGLAVGAQAVWLGSQWTRPACPLAVVAGLWACLGKQGRVQ